MGFTFGKNSIDIEICGKIYTVDPFSSKVLEGVTTYQQALTSAREHGSTPDNVTNVCALIGALTDAILGDGAYKEIFAGREANFLDHQELATHLLTVITAYRSKRLDEFAQSAFTTSRDVLGMH